MMGSGVRVPSPAPFPSFPARSGSGGVPSGARKADGSRRLFPRPAPYLGFRRSFCSARTSAGPTSPDAGLRYCDGRGRCQGLVAARSSCSQGTGPRRVNRGFASSATASRLGTNAARRQGPPADRFPAGVRAGTHRQHVRGGPARGFHRAAGNRPAACCKGGHSHRGGVSRAGSGGSPPAGPLRGCRPRPKSAPPRARSPAPCGTGRPS